MSTTISTRLPDTLAKELAALTERSKAFHIQKALEVYLADQADLQIALDRLHDTQNKTVSIHKMKEQLGL